MYRIFWISILLLTVGCDGGDKRINSQALTSVSVYLSLVKSLDEQVSLYGYLSKKNDALFLYHSNIASSFSSSEAEKLRVSVYVPNDKIDPKCLDGYVSLYGISHNYLGEIAIDDIARVVSLNGGNLCYSNPNPVNYFGFLRKEISNKKTK